MDIELFDFNLPQNLIAQQPAIKRDLSRLMAVDINGTAISDHGFENFPDFLRDGDLLVINETKVFSARLDCYRKSGGKVELLLVRRLGNGSWKGMARGLGKLKAGETLNVGDTEISFIGRHEHGYGEFNFGSDIEVARITEKYGSTPIPPYIQRERGAADIDDIERYQTVFAKETGSCAAPTAGLHFTDKILESISNKGVAIIPITLHVGPGTFRPISTQRIEDHAVDAEWCVIPESSANAVNLAKREGRRVVAVGSTVTRTLEGSATKTGAVTAGAGLVDIYITPGFRFNVVDALLTNFHLPKSSLLVLISSFAGRDLTMSAYRIAIEREYRFYSYGDATFFYRV